MTVSPMLQRNDDSIQVSATELSITATPWEDWPGLGRLARVREKLGVFFGPFAMRAGVNCWCADENGSNRDCASPD